jgi:hypothetical protein
MRVEKDSTRMRSFVHVIRCSFARIRFPLTPVD